MRGVLGRQYRSVLGGPGASLRTCRPGLPGPVWLEGVSHWVQANVWGPWKPCSCCGFLSSSHPTHSHLSV